MFCFISEHEAMKKYCLDTLKKQGLVKETECPKSNCKMGYGDKIPTNTMVFVGNKWRRVYCCIYSNIGTCYVLIKGEQVIID